MKRFWVIFSHDYGRNRVEKAMDGSGGRSVAAEIRRKYPDAKIEAITVIREGVGVYARR